MKIKILDWDSNFFGFKVGEISDFSSTPIIVEDKDIKFIQTKLEEDIELNITSFEKKYKEGKVVFAKTLQKPHIIQQEVKDFDNAPLPQEAFYEIAYESGKYSRYKQDPCFSEDKFKHLYELWVENSINKSFATKIFYISNEEGMLRGFVTLKGSKNEACIGLIGVLPQYQGEGLGSALLKACENYGIETGIKTIYIPTQLENIPACNFYKKIGYEISEIVYIKHYWRDINEK